MAGNDLYFIALKGCSRAPLATPVTIPTWAKARGYYVR